MLAYPCDLSGLEAGPGNPGQTPVNLKLQIKMVYSTFSENPYLIWEVIQLFFTRVFQAGRLLLNQSDFSAFQNIF